MKRKRARGTVEPGPTGEKHKLLFMTTNNYATDEITFQDFSESGDIEEMTDYLGVDPEAVKNYLHDNYPPFPHIKDKQ